MRPAVRAALVVLLVLVGLPARADRRETYAVLGFDPGVTRYELGPTGSGAATKPSGTFSATGYYGLSNEWHLGGRLRLSKTTNLQVSNSVVALNGVKTVGDVYEDHLGVRGRRRHPVPGEHGSSTRPSLRAGGRLHEAQLQPGRVHPEGEHLQLPAVERLLRRPARSGGGPSRVSVPDQVGGGCGSLRPAGGRARPLGCECPASGWLRVVVGHQLGSIEGRLAGQG